jgi:DNA-binding MarR family transcriptional regulator
MTEQSGEAGEAGVQEKSHSVEDYVGYNLKRAYMIVHDDFRRALGEDGLGPRTFSALAIVSNNSGISQSDLARRLGIERSGMVAIVDELQREGMILRKPVSNDRRVHALVVTERGRDMIDEAHQKIRAHEDRLFAEFSAEERQTMIRLLKKIRTLKGE